MPMVVLWTLSVLLVLGYYFVPSVAGVLGPLDRWQAEQGWLAAFASRFFFCGLLPGAFILTVRALRVRSPLLTVVAQSVWSGVCGVLSDAMYTSNAFLFGTGVDLVTLSAKTAVCQFVWTPFVFLPLGTLVYLWIGRDFSLTRCRGELSSAFRLAFCSNLLVNWAIWIPGSMLLHLFPTTLQIQLSGFANTFFALVLLKIGRGERS